MQDLKEKLASISYEIAANKRVLDNSKETLAQCILSINILTLAAETLKAIGDQRKQRTVEVFEKVVTMALKEVFNFDYKFVIDIQSGVRVTTTFKLVMGDRELDIMNACGGGVVDVVSFVLRALVLTAIRPRLSRIMFLDESFKHVSGEYRSKVAQLLHSLSKQLDMKFVLVTHQQELLEAADVAYELIGGKDGTTCKKI